MAAPTKLVVVAFIAAAPAALGVSCIYDYDDARHCKNGVQDADETDVDCGGSCVAASASTFGGGCWYGSKCAVHADCAEGLANCDIATSRCQPNRLSGMWTKLPQDSKPPPPRYGAHLVIQGNRGFMHSGHGEAFTTLEDAWHFRSDTNDWDKATGPDSAAKAGPETGRFYYALASNEDQLFIAGGVDHDSRLNEVWARTWKDETWTQLADLPKKRALGTMAFDTRRRQLVFFGGDDSKRGEIWELPEEAWTTANAEAWRVVQTTGPAEDPTANGPTHRAHNSMAYDPNTGLFITFGGAVSSGGGKGSAETWTYDPVKQAWSPVETQLVAEDATPPLRWGHSMAYDSRRGRVVIFGGRTGGGAGVEEDSYHDLWEFDGARWWQADVRGELPKATRSCAFAYDPTRTRFVQFGCVVAYNPTDFTRTWTYIHLGQPCGSEVDCPKAATCVQNVCCESACESGACNLADSPGYCEEAPVE